MMKLQKLLEERITYKTRAGVELWLNTCKIKKYTINEDLTVDVNGDVSIKNKHILFLPIKFGVVTGNFSITKCMLHSLEGAPREVGEHFYCFANKLTSLEGGPREVGENFNCADNNLTSLKGAPREVGKNFDCDNNNLTSLEGAPREVGVNFSCRSNKLTSLEGGPREVGGSFFCGNNKLTSLEGGPREVGGDFDCSNNKFKEEPDHSRINIGGIFKWK